AQGGGQRGAAAPRGVPLLEAHLRADRGRRSGRHTGGGGGHLRGPPGRRQRQNREELRAGTAARRQGQGERDYQGRVRPRWLPVSRAREGGRRRRSQRRIGALMTHEQQPGPSGPGTIEPAETAHAGGEATHDARPAGAPGGGGGGGGGGAGASGGGGGGGGGGRGRGRGGRGRGRGGERRDSSERQREGDGLIENVISIN